MGKADYRHHEAKKPKKGQKKTSSVIGVETPPVQVEVIKKGKKPEEG